MNFRNLNLLVVIFYLISFGFVYSIDPPDNKNLIVHKEKKKIENIDFFSDPNNELAQRFNIQGIPKTILIDKNGYQFAKIVDYIGFENKDFLDWLINYL